MKKFVSKINYKFIGVIMNDKNISTEKYWIVLSYVYLSFASSLIHENCTSWFFKLKFQEIEI